MMKIFGERYPYVVWAIQAPASWARKLQSTFTWKTKAQDVVQATGTLQLHLGVGDKRIPGMLNCEYRATKAADVVMDCSDLSRFASGSVSRIFAHAFFEHLYRSQHASFINGCFRVLQPDGALVLLGLPDFEVIADAYIKSNQGLVETPFTLFDVYRYTHGDPEQYPGWWLAQLHKSLFDKKSVSNLLNQAGFTDIRIFNYRFPGDRLPLNIGVVAWKGQHTEQLRDALLPFREYFEHIDDVAPSEAAIEATS